MKIRHCLLSLTLSISICASMLTAPLSAFAADTADGTGQTIEESSPADDATVDQEEPADQNSTETAEQEEQKNEQPAEELTENPTASDTEKNASETAETAATEPDVVEEQGIVTDSTAADTAIGSEESNVEATSEEIKEASVDDLLYGWEGPGVYTYFDSNGKTIGHKYRLTESKVHKGFKTVDGDPYYFDAKTGWMKTGWFTVNGYKYYGNTAAKFENGRGILYSGLKVIGGHHYYFFGSTRDGHYGKTMAKNTWVTTGGQKFYAGKDGKLICKFKTIGGKGYYFYPSGTSSHKYGQMAKGWFTYNNFKYYANPSTGVLTTGFKTIDGIHYYFYPKTSGKHYAKTMAKGWFTVNGFKYYAYKTGELASGWWTIDGKSYYFWPKTEGKHYSRTMACNGTFTIDGRKYKFKKDGSLDTTVDVTSYFESGNIYGLANEAGLYVDVSYPIYKIDSDNILYSQDDEYMTQMIICSNPRYKIYGLKVGDTESTVRSKVNATGKFKNPEKAGYSLSYEFKNHYRAGYYSMYLLFNFKNGKVSNWVIGIYAGE